MKLMYSTQKTPENEVVFINFMGYRQKLYYVILIEETSIASIRIDSRQDIFS